MTKLKSTIRHYGKRSLTESSCPKNPLDLFNLWLSEAITSEPFEPNAMTLATVNSLGQPSARIVLLKDVNEAGFTFFTNYHSAKAEAMSENNQVALVFWWPVTERQVRIEGTVQKTSPTESTEYFKIRSKDSKLGAHASPQSQIILDRKVLDKRFAELQEFYAKTDEIPRPEHWGGYRVSPHKIEFWQGGLHRLHDRICYTLLENQWFFCRLAP